MVVEGIRDNSNGWMPTSTTDKQSMPKDNPPYNPRGFIYNLLQKPIKIETIKGTNSQATDPLERPIQPVFIYLAQLIQDIKMYSLIPLVRTSWNAPLPTVLLHLPHTLLSSTQSTSQLFPISQKPKLPNFILFPFPICDRATRLSISMSRHAVVPSKIKYYKHINFGDEVDLLNNSS
jgi:hypothetical protein